jgi:uncharacterized protein (DUF488 family)
LVYRSDPTAGLVRLFGVPILYTVGHGLLPIDALVANLSRHEVEAVIDVRSQPFSGRAPQFNRENLSSELEAAGITYIWMGQTLGGRPPERLRTPAGAPDYELMAREPATVAALDKVVEAATRRRIALLCSEARPEGCHRTRMLEPQLEERGAAVQHILPEGNLASQPTLFV